MRHANNKSECCQVKKYMIAQQQKHAVLVQKQTRETKNKTQLPAL